MKAWAANVALHAKADNTHTITNAAQLKRMTPSYVIIWPVFSAERWRSTEQSSLTNA